MQKIFQQVITQTHPKILGIAKNYVKPGSKDLPSEPQIFQKPFSALLYNQNTLNLQTQNQVNYEIELGIMISKKGKNIPRNQFLDYIGGYFLVLDITDWDTLQHERKNGFPWDFGKGQDGFCPVSDFIDKDKIKDLNNVRLQLSLNNKTEVDDTTQDMYYKVDFLIEHISKYMTLNQGDLILSGTPKMGPIKNGDVLNAKMFSNNEKLAEIQLNIIKNK